MANGELEVVEVDDPVATLERLERRIERNDRWRMPLTFVVGGLAYLAAAFAPRLAPRVFLVALAANLWIAGWWVVALVALAGVLLPLGFACAAVLAAYLLVLGLDQAVALSPFGPVAGRALLRALEPARDDAPRPGVPRRLGARPARDRGGGARGRRRRGKSLRCRWRRPARAARRVRDAAPPRRGPSRPSVRASRSRRPSSPSRSRSSGSTRRSAARATSPRRSEDGPGSLLGHLADRLELSVRRSAAAFGPGFVVLASSAVLVAVAIRRPRRPVTDALLVALLVSLVVNDPVGRRRDRRRSGRRDPLLRGASPRVSRSSLYRLRAMRRPLTVLALLLAAIAMVAVGCSEGR